MENYYESNNVLNSGNGLEGMSFFDLLNLPVQIAIPELACRGIKAINSVRQTARETFQALADQEYLEMCRPVLTLEQCVRWIQMQRTSFPQIAYLFIYVEKNPNPRNENDLLSIAVAGIDANKRAIPLTDAVVSDSSKLFPQQKSTATASDKDIVCVVVPAKTIDEKLIGALNGNTSVLIKL